MCKLNLYLLPLLISVLLISCQSEVELEFKNTETDLTDSLYISQGSSPSQNNIVKISKKTLEISQALNLYTVLSKNEVYEPVSVKWTLIGLIGDLNVNNGGAQAKFLATTAGSGYIEVSYQGITKKVTLEILEPIGLAPVTTSPDLIRLTENQQETLQLDYTDNEGDLATSCSISNLVNLSETTPCNCSSGTCQVGVTGSSDYTGNASFNFVVSSKGQISNSSTVDINILPECPDGYLAVDGSPTFGTSNFCVMKFEAKDIAGTPTSIASNLPWNAISALDAFTACDNISLPGYTGNFSLISNSEWMTIAWDIEDTKENWSSGVVGTGHIPRGHSDTSPNTRLAVTDENDPYDGTGNSASDIPGSGWEQKRTHILQNGNIIWDLSGNMFEWVDWNASDAGFTDGPKNEATGEKELSVDPTGSLQLIEYKPRDDSYGAANSFGRWSGGNGGAAIRGDDYQNSDFAGIYRLDLFFANTRVHANIGFRCVYRP